MKLENGSTLEADTVGYCEHLEIGPDLVSKYTDFEVARNSDIMDLIFFFCRLLLVLEQNLQLVHLKV